MSIMSQQKWLLRGMALVGICLLTDRLFGQGMSAPVASSTASGTPNLLTQLPPEVQFAVTTLGFGGIAGWCVGFTLKKFAKLMALLVGTILIAIQFLAFHKFIAIDWVKIRETVPDSSLQQLWLGLMSVITYNVPFAGAFAIVFFLGFRNG